MNYKKYGDLDLLPINIEIFAADGAGTIVTSYSNTVKGTYGAGEFPADKYLLVTKSCIGGSCFNILSAGTYTFNGISTSNTSFIPIITAEGSTSFTTYLMDQGTGSYPYVSKHVLSSEETSIINELDPGTYYVWYDDESHGTLTITSTAFVGNVSVSKNFVITNKLGNNPVLSSLTWENPSSSTLYYYTALSTTVAPLEEDIVYGWYGPYSMAARGSGNVDISTQYINSLIYENGLSDGDTLRLVSYVTDIPGTHAQLGGFGGLTGSIFRTDPITVRNIEFRFTNPEANAINRQWGDSISMPLLDGYTSIGWSNYDNLSSSIYSTGSYYSTSSDASISSWANRLNSNVYWLNMSATGASRIQYGINHTSGLNNYYTTNWINSYHSYEIESSPQTISLFPSTVHDIAASEYNEFTFNGFTISLDGGDPDVLSISDSNVLTIPGGVTGNIDIRTKWDYQYNNQSGTMSAINNGTHTDIMGTSGNYDGYTYYFKTPIGSPNDVDYVNYTSNIEALEDTSVTFIAQSKPGYEFLEKSIITYPFDKDGLIGDTPYMWIIGQRVNDYQSILPAPLYRNSGTVTVSQKIHPYIAGDIEVGIKTRPFEHPIFVSFGSNMSSFNYNGEKYNTSWTDKYTYNDETYYKLNGATFNVVSDSFQYHLTDMVTATGFYAPSYTIDINGLNITTNEQILNNSFVNLEDAQTINYHINTSVTTGIEDAEITPNIYNVISGASPSITSINKSFGYNNVSILGTKYVGGTSTVIDSSLTSIEQVPIGSTYDYNYLISAEKETYYFNKDLDNLPDGVSSYTLDKESYQISSSSQVVNVSYIMNDGYEMNGSSIKVTNFYRMQDDVIKQINMFGGWSHFTVLPNFIGNALIQIPDPEKIEYSIRIASEAIGINGFDSMTFNKDNYYISDTKQEVSVSISVEDGYDKPTDNLIITGGKVTDVSNNSFNINAGSFGNISITPGMPLLNTYELTINPVSIPDYSISGINSVDLVKNTYNVETPTFMPTINSITYTDDNAFSGYTIDPSLTAIQQGSHKNIDYIIYATPIEFNIYVEKDESINSYNYDGSHYIDLNSKIDQYNFLSTTKEIFLNDIVVNNFLYMIKPNFMIGEIVSESNGDRTFSLSSSLKTNSITLTDSIEGYESISFSDSTYTATKAGPKTITLTYTMDPGYDKPTDVLQVSNVRDDSDSEQSVTTITNKSFVIPKNSWGDIDITVGNPIVLEYHPIMSTIPIGVESGTQYNVNPINYNVTDNFSGSGKMFTVSAINKIGYRQPTWTVDNAIKMNDTSFRMSTFNTTPPSIFVEGGDIITYNMNIIKGTGISSYDYGSTTYDMSSTVSTYNVLSTKSIQLTNIKTINKLFKPVANYQALSVSSGNTGDKSNTVSTSLRTATSIVNGTLPTGIGTMTISPSTYDTKSSTTPVGISYVMNNGYRLPSSMSVLGSLNDMGGPVSINPSNANEFTIPAYTWNTLTVTPSNPSKIFYDIEDGVLPYGINKATYRFSTPITGYEISTSSRTVTVEYTMNNGYSAPVNDLTLSGNGSSFATVTNNRSFGIPINGYGDLTVTPGEPVLEEYDINNGSIPVGISGFTINPSTYSISNALAYQNITLGYTMETGYSKPTSQPTITGSNLVNITVDNFGIKTNGYGDITVTPSRPILKTYTIDISSNPNTASINKWSVSPSTYTVLDDKPMFAITCDANPGYYDPTWSINGTTNSAPSFSMETFSETVPVLRVNPGSTIPYDINLVYSQTNSGIQSADISHSTYNVETTTFKPTIQNVDYVDGYSGYSVTPPIVDITKGTIGHKTYTMQANPITYNITGHKGNNGVGISTATLSRSTYNVEDTPFNVNWNNITLEPGYDTYTLTGDALSVAAGKTGHLDYTITANEELYHVTIIKPADIISYKYNGGEAITDDTKIIDTFTISSPDLPIVLTDIVYDENYSGSVDTTRNFGTISGGTLGDVLFNLADVKNVYIDVQSWTSDDNQSKHYKIVSFKYDSSVHGNERTYVVNNKDQVWIDYFVEDTPPLTINITDIAYEDGYDGPDSYSFGTINTSVDDDVVYELNQTTLKTYKVYMKKDSTIQQFQYKDDFTSNGNILTVTNNNLIEVEFNVQSKLDVSISNIVYTDGYEGYNNGNIVNPTSSVYFDATSYNRASDIGSSNDPLLVTYDMFDSETNTNGRLTIYTINFNKTDPSGKLTSFNEIPTDKTFTVVSNEIPVSVTDLVYKTGTNADGTWALYTGPESYSFDPILTGTTENKTFSIPVDSITNLATFNITYTGETSSVINGYISEITGKKTSYVYKSGETITHNSTNSFTVVENTEFKDISDRLEANNPIHCGYTLDSSSAGISVSDTEINISAFDFGDKVININWTPIKFNMSISDHYTIKDVYGIKEDINKISPITGSVEDTEVFNIEYYLHKDSHNYTVTSTNVDRTGWTFINARETNGVGTIEATGTNRVTGFTVPGNWYDDRTLRLVYTPNTYTINLTGADPLKVIYDHEIQKWSPVNKPHEENKIFNGFKDPDLNTTQIDYSGLYNFNNNTYSSDVTFVPEFITRKDFLTYNATDNVVVDTEQLEEITLDAVSYSRFKETFICPTLVQTMITDDSLSSNGSSSNSKYIFNLIDSNIKFRKINDHTVTYGYKYLTFISPTLYTYLEGSNELVSDMSNLLDAIEGQWDNAIVSDLVNIGSIHVHDYWSQSDNRAATSDVFKIMFKVSNSVNGPFTYWVFDVMIPTDELDATKKDKINQQDMFLFSTEDNRLKEIMKIFEKDNDIVPIYDRTVHVIDNNDILTNWEDSIDGINKPVDVYGLLPVNKDKVYSMDMNMKIATRSEDLEWNNFTPLKLPYNSNTIKAEGKLNYKDLPIGDIYKSSISNMSNLTLSILKEYSVIDGKVIVDNLDSILGSGATEKEALSSDGEFYLPTLYYTLSIDNANSSSLRTATLNMGTKQYVYTPTDRNIGEYVVQGPVANDSNELMFLLSDLTYVEKVHIGKLDSSDLNNITELVELTNIKDTNFEDTNWFKLPNTSSVLAANNYYTIVIETEDKLMYNNLLIYKQYGSVSTFGFGW